uniref:non-specific serine/threonine protein kinase n=1 Tax=Otolemur garnettii TaxID=30611 RepID=H0XIP7_OTOGA
MLETIGQGSFTRVMLAQHLRTGTKVEVKILSKHSASGLMSVSSDTEIVKNLDHPNIIKLLDVIEGEDNVYLIIEYAGGRDLAQRILRLGQMEEREAQAIFLQILKAVQYLHKEGIVHWDLKPHNILLDAQNNVKLANFRLATTFTEGKRLNTFCGILYYLAPEIFLQEYSGPEADIWSLGVILHTMMAGTVPFHRQILNQLQSKVINATYAAPLFCSKKLKTFIKKILTPDPRERLTLSQIMEDPWMKSGPSCAPQPGPVSSSSPSSRNLRGG